MTQGAVRQQLTNLDTWHKRGLKAEQSIRDSINAGWQGLFEPRVGGGYKGAPARSDGERNFVNDGKDRH